MPRLSATRPEAIRRHNLSVVLQEVHRDGVLTRAELTQRLGMSRSTIGALVTELVDLEMLQESVPSGGTRAGRPSHVVGPHDRGPYVLAADVDVTHTVIAAVGIGGDVLARHYIPTNSDHPRTPSATAKLIGRAAEHLQRECGRAEGPAALGVSVPGTVQPHTGHVGFAPNLEWRDIDFGALISSHLDRVAGRHVPVVVGNDANLSMLAEHVRGVARDIADAVFLIGRTGVGAGIMSNGLPLGGLDGYAGEIGHNVVDASGPKCHCGKRGCLETFVGAAALLAAAGAVPPATDDRVVEVLAAARSGEPAAREAVCSVARQLGRGLATLVNTLNPQLVILGGTLAEVLALAGKDLRRSLRQYSLAPPFATVQLAEPALKADSALLGAAEIALAELLADPSGWQDRRASA